MTSKKNVFLFVAATFITSNSYSDNCNPDNTCKDPEKYCDKTLKVCVPYQSMLKSNAEPKTQVPQNVK